MSALIPTPDSLIAWVHPRTPLGRARLTLLVCLIVLTAGAWLLTIYQAQTMDMPMGVVARGGSVAPDTPASGDGMASMGDAAMNDAGAMATSGMGERAGRFPGLSHLSSPGR